MKDLSNENVIHVKKNGVEYLQFRKLLEYSDIIKHAYAIGLEPNFRTARAKNATPLTKEEYEKFWKELVEAEVVTLHEFEKNEIFEGCMPIEIMAKRGIDTLRFGPLKPVGFDDPRTAKRPYAVVQLRQDDTQASLYNLVGFQKSIFNDTRIRKCRIYKIWSNASQFIYKLTKIIR